ncbi:hypothetical protein NDU88_008962 [Pleurodeles waltl]|uniref:Uncharacterized protein n=1 Tax=Pleurodeles waltl TaxID=8319 RepID=A0AAV7N6G9_PLEWA|nr:hypothetical protein NDU88_008962 [Pleurodeles waltl]
MRRSACLWRASITLTALRRCHLGHAFKKLEHQPKWHLEEDPLKWREIPSDWRVLHIRPLQDLRELDQLEEDNGDNESWDIEVRQPRLMKLERTAGCENRWKVTVHGKILILVVGLEG